MQFMVLLSDYFKFWNAIWLNLTKILNFGFYLFSKFLFQPNICWCARARNSLQICKDKVVWLDKIWKDSVIYEFFNIWWHVFKMPMGSSPQVRWCLIRNLILLIFPQIFCKDIQNTKRYEWLGLNIVNRI